LEILNVPLDNGTCNETDLTAISEFNIIGLFQICTPYGDGTWYYTVGSGDELVFNICDDSTCKTNCTARIDLKLGCDVNTDSITTVYKGIPEQLQQKLESLNNQDVDYIYFAYYGVDSSCQTINFEELNILSSNASCIQNGDTGTFDSIKCEDGAILLTNCIDNQCTQNCTTIETHVDNACELGQYGYAKLTCRGDEFEF